MTTCPFCGHEVPEGEYCGACGAHLSAGSADRPGAFAADPTQHVLRPNVVSTLFPHLPHRHSMPFRLGLLLLAILLIVLGVLRLTGPGIAVAATGVPLLYLLYLYEVEVYDEEPWLVVGLTFGLGIALGIPWGVFTGPLVTRALRHNALAGITPGATVTVGVVLPLAAQTLMLAGALILYVRGRYREPLDGFTFGAAGALGFTLATTLVNLGPELHRGLIGGAPALISALTIAAQGLLIPFLNAGTTGLIAGALWLRRMPGWKPPFSWPISLASTVAMAAAVRIVLGISGITVFRMGTVVVIYLVVAAILLLWVRLGLHAMLLAEAPEAAIGPAMPCAHCHHVVPRMAFCPVCGIATQATPKFGPGQVRRALIAEGRNVDAAGAPYQPAGREGLEALRRGHSPARRWGAVAAVVAAGALALGVAAALLAPAPRAACGALCAPPPPPCLTVSCTHALSAPPLTAHQTYTSSKYGYSVGYTRFAPSSTDDTSAEWDLSTDAGQYAIVVTAGHDDGRSAGEIVRDVVDNNFPDYSSLYQVPGAEVGYTLGAGAVYDDETTPFFGSASDSRLVVLAAVKKGLAIAVVGSGDAAQSQSDHPDPSGLPISSFVDDLTNGTRWPGAPPR